MSLDETLPENGDFAVEGLRGIIASMQELLRQHLIVRILPTRKADDQALNQSVLRFGQLLPYQSPEQVPVNFGSIGFIAK